MNRTKKMRKHGIVSLNCIEKKPRWQAVPRIFCHGSVDLAWTEMLAAKSS